jgi:hypothetical protein
MNVQTAAGWTVYVAEGEDDADRLDTLAADARDADTVEVHRRNPPDEPESVAIRPVDAGGSGGCDECGSGFGLGDVLQLILSAGAALLAVVGAWRLGAAAGRYARAGVARP